MLEKLRKAIEIATQPEPGRDALISYMKLRQAVGWPGILIPEAVIICSLLFGDCHVIQPTISHYYYTTARELFVGTLCAVSLFLFCYKGCSKLDSRCSNIAGFFGVVVALFPTDVVEGKECQHDWVALINLPYHDKIHFVAAALFFLTLAFMSIVLFTMSNKLPEQRGPEKKTRNRIYRICGCTMVISIACFGIYFQVAAKPYDSFFGLGCETIALWAFGFSWLTKGQVIAGDKDANGNKVAIVNENIAADYS